MDKFDEKIVYSQLFYWQFDDIFLLLSHRINNAGSAPSHYGGNADPTWSTGYQHNVQYPGAIPQYQGQATQCPGYMEQYPGQVPQYSGQVPHYPGQIPQYPGQAPQYPYSAAPSFGAPAPNTGGVLSSLIYPSNIPPPYPPH